MATTRFSDTSGPLPFAGAIIPALAADAATIQYPIFRAPFACKLARVSVIPQAAVSGHASNRKDLNLLNKGTTGAGASAIGGKDMTAGVDFVACDEFDVYAPPNPNTGALLAAGDVVALEIEDNGTSPAFPQLLVYVEILAR